MVLVHFLFHYQDIVQRQALSNIVTSVRLAVLWTMSINADLGVALYENRKSRDITGRTDCFPYLHVSTSLLHRSFFSSLHITTCNKKLSPPNSFHTLHFSSIHSSIHPDTYIYTTAFSNHAPKIRYLPRIFFEMIDFPHHRTSPITSSKVNVVSTVMPVNSSRLHKTKMNFSKHSSARCILHNFNHTGDRHPRLSFITFHTSNILHEKRGAFSQPL